MPFFTDSTADTVQLISLPLEIVGLTFAFIELKHPKTADRIEGWIDDWDEKLRNLVKYPVAGIKYYRPGRIILLLGYPLILTCLLILNWKIVMEKTGFLIAFILLIAVSSLYLFSFFMPALVRFLNEYSNGRALGTFGLILAGLGGLGEIYQVLNMYF